MGREASLESVGMLAAGRCGLGITFYDPRSQGGRLMVKRVKGGGAAERSGGLQAGDEILEIDGVKMSGVGTRQLSSMIMGEEGSKCRLTVRHGDSTLSSVLLTRTSAERGEQSRASIGGDRQLQKEEKQEAGSQREEKHEAKAPWKLGLGILFAERDEGGGRVILKMKAGSGAAETGKLEPGDRLVSIDSVELDGLDDSALQQLIASSSESPAVCVVKKADESIRLVMVPRKLYEEKEEEEEEEVGSRQVGLVGLGMVFLKPDGKGGRVIKRLKPGSASELSGRIHPGDRCLSIDGSELGSISDAQLSRLNRGAEGSEVEVKIKSKEGGTFSLLLSRSSFGSMDEDQEPCVSEASFGSSVWGSRSGGRRQCGFGLTFFSWDGTSEGFQVKRVKEGGAAQLSGEVEEGDLVISIDGKKLSGCSNKEVQGLILGAGEKWR